MITSNYLKKCNRLQLINDYNYDYPMSDILISTITADKLRWILYCLKEGIDFARERFKFNLRDRWHTRAIKFDAVRPTGKVWVSIKTRAGGQIPPWRRFIFMRIYELLERWRGSPPVGTFGVGWVGFNSRCQNAPSTVLTTGI